MISNMYNECIGFSGRAHCTEVRLYNLIRQVGRGQITADNALHQIMEDYHELQLLGKHIRDFAERWRPAWEQIEGELLKADEAIEGVLLKADEAPAPTPAEKHNPEWTPQYVTNLLTTMGSVMADAQAIEDLDWPGDDCQAAREARRHAQIIIEKCSKFLDAPRIGHE